MSPALTVIVVGNSVFGEFGGEGDFADGPALSTERANCPAHLGTDSALSGVLSE